MFLEFVPRYQTLYDFTEALEDNLFRDTYLAVEIHQGCLEIYDEETDQLLFVGRYHSDLACQDMLLLLGFQDADTEGIDDDEDEDYGD